MINEIIKISAHWILLCKTLLWGKKTVQPHVLWGNFKNSLRTLISNLNIKLEFLNKCPLAGIFESISLTKDWQCDLVRAFHCIFLCYKASQNHKHFKVLSQENCYSPRCCVCFTKHQDMLVFTQRILFIFFQFCLTINLLPRLKMDFQFILCCGQSGINDGHNQKNYIFKWHNLNENKSCV